MLATCCAWLTLTVASPFAFQQDGELTSNSVRVQGPVELSPAAADAAALSIAIDQVHDDLRRRAELATSRIQPRWLPVSLARRLGSEWLANQDARPAIRIVGRDQQVRDHGSFESFQTELLICHDERMLDRMLADLGAELRRRGRVMAMVAAGATGLWTLLLVAYWWLDRVTRGYMPWRLRFVCAGIGLLAPGVALFFV